MPSSLLLSYYGDDLTGSTDVMEALSLGGIATVLFLDPPSAEQLACFADCQAIGLAGTSRSETPEWMDDHLHHALAWLRSLGADLCHYKVCSTFDSAPGVGNIGRALEIGRALFGQSCVPLVVGAPQLKRYTVFGQHFAMFQGDVHRLDRHPVMSRHPVTPMGEADLRRHLAGQTELSIGLADLLCLAQPDIDERIDRLSAGHQVLLYDVLDTRHQAEVGHQLWRTRQPRGSYVVGSSGVEYALLEAWRRQQRVPATVPSFTPPGAVDQLAVVSGSCSEVTARQIRWAEANGFRAIGLDVAGLIGDEHGEGVMQAVLEAAGDALADGMSVIVHTAMGPETNASAVTQGDPQARHRIGRSLGQLLRRLVEIHGLRRVAIAGGDTSSHALRELNIHALTTRLPLPETPGSPLCRAYSDDPTFDGLEIALKGGQIGSDAYFVNLRNGRA
ncbi:four-carbon acid sugar kinase family protein [Halomonas sp. MCCC 1A11036]|uniref:Four-carbon acid sugar kinase family protein n=1 Tax=Billgrantia zhangzhouensis TaxID=2733481 RepID=A0ABS9AGQ8_9GAMM|nr:four-carbon acid sugar kinase family protein [Halomonas zhangzhouensis]MCE8020943.1 four-carbon acid sugar kinase family protein [Halomonas zhangzhouensis]